MSRCNTNAFILLLQRASCVGVAIYFLRDWNFMTASMHSAPSHIFLRVSHSRWFTAWSSLSTSGERTNAFDCFIAIG